MITDFPSWFTVRGKQPRGSSTFRSGKNGRERRRKRPLLEMLEPRRVLSTITWNTTQAPTGGDWNTASNWSPAQVPGPADTAVIAGFTGSGIVSINSNAVDSVMGLSINRSTTLKVNSGSLTLGAGPSTIGGAVDVASGATLNVAASATVTISYEQSITDDGMLNFSNGDIVTLASSGGNGSAIVVAGTMNATGADLQRTRRPHVDHRGLLRRASHRHEQHLQPAHRRPLQRCPVPLR